MGFGDVPSQFLDQILRLDLDVEIVELPELSQWLSQTVLYQGKRLRPLLCFLVGHSLGISTEQLIPYARAAEFVHAATLAHDDVIDESPIRRLRPTLNAEVGNTRAVLAGDLLLARVMAELASIGRMNIIYHLAKTVEDLVSGEWMQLGAKGRIDVNFEHLQKVAIKKTGSLMAWCCQAPGLILNLDPTIIEAFGEFGERLGVAFQMMDDVLDFQGNLSPRNALILKKDLNLSGKIPLQDLNEGLINFVALELVKMNPEMKQALAIWIQNRKNPETSFPWTPSQLKSACQKVRVKAAEQLEKAQNILDLLETRLHKQHGYTMQALSKKALDQIIVSLKKRTS